ncbi:MAG: DUF5317 domain-containing protein, partial [Anaerolineales bacterium]|nr:DUF5317 domain-containing protein [Anaerolineales bacterium]
LLSAIVLGLTVGLAAARIQRRPYQPPNLGHPWLVFAAFLPQFAILYLPSLRQHVSDLMAGLLLTVSQLLLIAFVWLNRKQPGVSLLLLGATLNFTVMAANRGFMPISPQTASRLVPQSVLMNISTGSRFGLKDILLHPEQTRFEWLADRFLPPDWFPYQVAFSLGDVFLALGIFWLLAVVKP